MSDVTLKMLLLGEDRGASKALDSVGDSADTAEGRLGKFGTGGKAALGKVAAGLAALGGGALVLDQFNKALDVGAGTSKLTAQLGLTKSESATAGKVAGKLFGQGYGTGMEQVQEAIGSVIQNIDGMRTASDSTLTRIAGKVTNTANIFDQDLGGVTRAVSQMMRTGLAKNADEALDTITRGFQAGADKSEDFLDTLNEYGTQFRKMGIDGQMATGLISQGLKAGARDSDIVADSIKEFSLRTQGALEQTDSKGRVHLTSLGSAFKAVLPHGTDMYKMQEQLAKGGASGRKGLDTMLDGLRGMENPLYRSQMAVQLFGTQAEDMGDALYALDPSKAVATLGKVEGAADKAGEAFNDNAKAKIGTFFRGFQEGAVNIIGGKVIPALEKLEPIITGVFGYIDKHKTTFVTLGVVVGAATVLVQAHGLAMSVAAAGGMAKYLASTQIISSVTKAWAAVQWAMNAALSANPIGIVVIALAALAAGLVYAYKHSETFRNIVNGAFHAVGEAGRWLWNSVLQPVFSFLAKGFAFVMDMYAKMLDGLSRVPGFGWAKNAADALHNGADKARELAGSIRQIPDSHNTNISTSGLGSTSSALADYRRQLDNLPTYIRTQIITQHTDKFDRIDRRATGGPIRSGVPYLVGENGPELIVPDSSGMVVNADGTQRLGGGSGAALPALAGGSSGDGGHLGTVTLELKMGGKIIQTELLSLKRTNGGAPLGIG